MSAELYQQYEEDFLNYLGNVTRTADNLSTSSKGKALEFIDHFLDKKEMAIHEVQAELQNAENCVSRINFDHFHEQC